MTVTYVWYCCICTYVVMRDIRISILTAIRIWWTVGFIVAGTLGPTLSRYEKLYCTYTNTRCGSSHPHRRQSWTHCFSGMWTGCQCLRCLCLVPQKVQDRPRDCFLEEVRGLPPDRCWSESFTRRSGPLHINKTTHGTYIACTCICT